MKKILIVDDEPDIRLILKDHFEEFGYKVTEADNGVTALKKFLKGSFDVVITDIKMPEMNGLEFSSKIRETDSEVPIYLVTAFSEYTEKDIIAIGAEAIIFKPFDLSEVVDVVDKRVRGLSNEKS